MTGKTKESIDWITGSTVILLACESSSTTELRINNPARTINEKLCKKVIIVSQANIRQKNNGKNANFAACPLVTCSSGSVIQSAPVSIPPIERIDDTMLNQLRSTFIPSSFSKMFVWEPFKEIIYTMLVKYCRCFFLAKLVISKQLVLFV